MIAVDKHISTVMAQNVGDTQTKSERKSFKVLRVVPGVSKNNEANQVVINKDTEQ